MKHKLSWNLALVWSLVFLLFTAGCGGDPEEPASDEAASSEVSTNQIVSSETVDSEGSLTSTEAGLEGGIDFSTLDSFVETNEVDSRMADTTEPTNVETETPDPIGMTDTGVDMSDVPMGNTDPYVSTEDPDIVTNMEADEIPDLAALDEEENGPFQSDSGSASNVGIQDDLIPLVLLEDSDLPEAITFLAAQAGINFLFDPRVTEEQLSADGSPIPPRKVSIQFRDVTARAALDAVMANYGLEMIEDDKTGIARVTIKDPAAPPPLITEIIQLKYSSPTNFVTILDPTFSDSRSKSIADTRTSQIIVMATESEHEEVKALVDKLDKPTPQVLIEAHIVETSTSPSTSKGIDWSGTLANQNVSFGNGLTSREFSRTTPGPATTTTLPSGRTVTSSGGDVTQDSISSVLDPISGIIGLSLSTGNGFDPNTAFLNADGLSVALSFLNTQLDGKVVATPRTVTVDNEPARLEVFRSFPIFTITPGSANSPAGAEVTYTNMGTILHVTPRITANSNVNLKVIPEVSNIDGQDRQVINGQENLANIYAIRRVEASVLVPNQRTLVMGGLISDSVSKDYSKVPFLGDVPGLGRLFRKETKNRDKSNLIIFITPTIIAQTDYQETPRSDFLSTPKAISDIDSDWSEWDKAIPREKKPRQKKNEAPPDPEIHETEHYNTNVDPNLMVAPPLHENPPRVIW